MDALTNAITAYSTINGAFAQQRQMDRQDKLDAENQRRWDTENAMRTETHALQMKTGKLQLDTAQNASDDQNINRFANEVASTDHDPEKVLALYKKYESENPAWFKKVASNAMFKNTTERMAAYKELGGVVSQMPTNADPAAEQTWKTNAVAKMQKVMQLDGRLDGLPDAHVVDVTASPADPKKFNIQIQYKDKDGKLVNAFMTDGRVKSAEGGKATDYDIPTLMTQMQDKMKFLDGVGQLKLLANDKTAVDQLERKISNRKAIEILLQDPNTKTLLTNPIYGGLMQTQLKLNSEGVGTAESSMQIMSALQTKLADQKLTQQDAMFVNQIITDNYGAAISGKWSEVERGLKGMNKDPNRAASVKTAMDILRDAYKLGMTERNADRRAALASRAGSAPKTGELDQQALTGINALLSRANAAESGKETVTDQFGIESTKTVAVDPEAAARYREQAAQLTAQYAASGKVTPSMVAAVANSLPEQHRVTLVNTLKGHQPAPKRALNTRSTSTPTSANFGSSMGTGGFGSAMLSIPK